MQNSIRGTLMYCACASALAACQTAPKLPLDSPIRVKTAAEVADVSFTTTNVIHWYDIADDLQRVQFDYNQDKLLQEAASTTSSVNAASFDTLSATIAAAIAGETISKKVENKIDDTGKATQTLDRTSEITPPTSPGAVSFNIQPPTLPTTSPSSGSGADAQFKLRTAAALAEEIAIINKRVTSLPVAAAYRPYFVSLQLSILPKRHRLPYDTTIEIQFSVGDEKDRHVVVLPLLVTDAIEETKESQLAEVVRQLGAQLGGVAGPANISAGLQRTLSELASSEALRPNSLMSVGQLTKTTTAADGTATTTVMGNGLRVRLGANRFGQAYEMIPRTHNVSVVVLVPLRLAQENAARASEHPIEDPPGSGIFLARRTLDQRYVNIEAEVHYADATPPKAKASNSRAGPADDDTVAFTDPSLPGKVVIDGAKFPLPPVPLATCPSAQTAIATTAAGANGAAAGLEVALVGGRGLEGRRIEATLTTPPMATTSIAGKAVEKPLKLMATQVATDDGGVQLTFPPHVQGYPAPTAPKVIIGSLTLAVLDTRDGEGRLECPASIPVSTRTPRGSTPSRSAGYEVAYLLTPTPKSDTPDDASADKKKNAPAAPAAAAAAAADAGTPAAPAAAAPGSSPPAAPAAPADARNKAPPHATLPFQ